MHILVHIIGGVKVDYFEYLAGLISQFIFMAFIDEPDKSDNTFILLYPCYVNYLV